MLEIQDNASPQLLKIGFLVIMLFSILSQSLCVTRILGISMVPTLQNNSIVIAHKTTHIKHGDIVIFDGNNYGVKSNIIKRVIAIQGDRVTIRNNSLYINGKLQDEPYLSNDTHTYGYMELIVDRGTFFALGDNRELSLDSRQLGLIKCKDVIAVMGVVI